MTNLIDPAIVYDPVAAEHPTMTEDPDWRDRGSSSEMTSKLWHGDDGDFGGLTRFGMGWGPIEVRRADRFRSAVRERQLVRVLDLVVAGEARFRVSVTGERGVKIKDLQTNRELVTAAQLADAGAAIYDEGATDRLHARDVETLDPIGANAIIDDGTATTNTIPVDRDTITRLQDLTTAIQLQLTPTRREKRYVPRDAMNAIDELTTLLNMTVNR